jgi:heme exporter protein A
MRPFDPRLRDAVVFNGHLPALKDELTAEENLAQWIALHDGACPPAVIGEALDAVALERQRLLPVRVLSQGQRRRIGLARLRLVQRPLWILDEPLTALDADGIDVLRDLLGAHLDGGGLCVAASHQPLPVASKRERSLVLGGRVTQ